MFRIIDVKLPGPVTPLTPLKLPLRIPLVVRGCRKTSLSPPELWTLECVEDAEEFSAFGEVVMALDMMKMPSTKAHSTALAVVGGSHG